MNRIDNFSMNQMGLGPGQGQVAAQTGSWRGEALTPKDEVSALADAAEEISMHHSEKAEAKHFAERKVQAEGVATVLPAQQVMEYLQATQAYRDLMTQLEGTENRVATARRDYNEAVKTYNLRVKRFPGLVLAALFGYDAESGFESSDGAENAPSVNFDQ